MQNEQTYYAVQITYPMPEFLSDCVTPGEVSPEVMDYRFYTRATTMADLYIDLRKFAIEIATEAKEAVLIQTGAFDIEPSFTVEELEGLVSPVIRKIVAITHPSTTDALTTAIAIEERLGHVAEAIDVIRLGGYTPAMCSRALEFKASVSRFIRDVITRHLYDNPEEIDLGALDQAIDEAHTFLQGLRQAK